jgi:hypothetical protein
MLKCKGQEGVSSHIDGVGQPVTEWGFGGGIFLVARHSCVSAESSPKRSLRMKITALGRKATAHKSGARPPTKLGVRTLVSLALDTPLGRDLEGPVTLSIRLNTHSLTPRQFTFGFVRPR